VILENLTYKKKSSINNLYLNLDKLSAFGRVILLGTDFNDVEEDRTNLTMEIEAELEPAFRQAVNDETLNVSVVTLQRAFSNEILVHVEILLPDQSSPPNISGLVLNESLYTTEVRFNSKFKNLSFQVHCSFYNFPHLFTKLFRALTRKNE